MGYIAHHAIVVTGQDDSLKPSHALAVSLGCLVSPILGPGVNGYCSFFVAPDGSKEGWESSNEGDTRRADLVEHLLGNGIEFVEVRFGGDDPHLAKIENHDHDWVAPGDER